MKRLLREADVYMGEKERQLSFNDPLLDPTIALVRLFL
jgi:hypothetical protein